MCCQERNCFAHWSQAWQRCDTAHVFEGFTRVFLSLIHVQPTIKLCVSMHRQEEMLLFKNVSFIQQLRIIFLWPPFDEWEYTERRDYCELSYKAGTHSLGQRSFPYAAPSDQNCLPCKVRSSNTLAALKSYFFKLSYCVCVYVREHALVCFCCVLVLFLVMAYMAQLGETAHKSVSYYF